MAEHLIPNLIVKESTERIAIMETKKDFSKIHNKWEGKIYSLIASNNDKFEAMSTYLSTNDTALASMQSHPGLTTDVVAIPPTKSPIKNLQGVQAASLKLQGILKKKCGKV